MIAYLINKVIIMGTDVQLSEDHKVLPYTIHDNLRPVTAVIQFMHFTHQHFNKF